MLPVFGYFDAEHQVIERPSHIAIRMAADSSLQIVDMGTFLHYIKCITQKTGASSQ